MSKTRGMARAASLAIMAAAVYPGSCYAVAKKGIETVSKTAVERPIIDQNGVDLFSGRYGRKDVHLSIGDLSKGGLQWSYSLHSTDADVDDEYTGKITLDNSVNIDSGKTKVIVSSGADSFYRPLSASGACTTDCINSLGRASTLVKSGTEYIYTNSVGDTFYFDALPGTISPPYTGTIARLKRIEQANGIKITISYDEIGTSCTGPAVGCRYRINSVTSNTGYALKYEYHYSNSAHLKKVYAVNLMTGSCTFVPLNCSSYDNVISVAYPSMSLLDITRPGNETYRYGVVNEFAYFEIDVLSYFRRPLGGETTVIYDDFARATSLTTIAGQWGYGYSDSNFDSIKSEDGRTTGASNPGGGPSRSYHFSKSSQLPSYEINELNKRTNYGTVQLSSGPLAIGKVTKPEGDYVSYTYDGRGNILTETSVNKAASSNRTLSFGFDGGCSNQKTCNKPNWARDAANNQTDYAYSPTHGGVVKVTLPTDRNGLRRRTYSQYEAFNTGDGTIQRLSRTETCGLTATEISNADSSNAVACPSGPAKIVTITSYGTATTAPRTYKTLLPYQVTQTDGLVGGLSATTAYSYDNMGNVIAVDGPLPGAVDASYTTYDANRRIIFEIGVDPDGPYVGACPPNPGCRQRQIMKHVYDLDGNETETRVGYGNETNGSDFVTTSFTRRSFDKLGRAIKTEQVQP